MMFLSLLFIKLYIKNSVAVVFWLINSSSSERYCFDFRFTCSSSIGAQQIKVLSRVKIVIRSRKVKHSEMTDKRYVTGAFCQAAVCALITEVPFGEIGWARLLIEANRAQTDGIGILWVVFLRESPW